MKNKTLENKTDTRTGLSPYQAERTEAQQTPVGRTGPLGATVAPPGSEATVRVHAVGLNRATAGRTVRRLQRQYGNRYVQRVVAQRQGSGEGALGGVQAKLTVGPVRDHYEQEADLAAERLVPMPVSAATRTPMPANRVVEEDKLLQGKFDAVQLKQEHAPQPNRTGLPDNLKAGIENLSGMSMDHVKVHYNSAQPAQVNALAYTQGADIYVASGQEQHLPHETWHVVQQAQGRVEPTARVHGAAINDSVTLEREAEEMGRKAQSLGVSAAQGRMARSGASGEVVQRTTWEQLLAISGLQDVHKLKLAEIAKGAGIVPSDPVATIFTQLVAYGHTHFAYAAGMSEFKPALLANEYNCESISHLLIHLVVVAKGDTAVSVENVTSQPLLYNRPLPSGGFNNQDPNVSGQPYLVFTGGHSMARIAGTLYDPTTGVSGGMNANYITGTVPKKNQYQFILRGITANMRRVTPDKVTGGLWQLEIY